MPWFAWGILFVLAALILYLWLIAPARRRPADNPFSGRLCAHRGLHDGNHTVFENSMAAFARAADTGYGIEMDVQLTKDRQLVVHHDASTARICGVDCEILQHDYTALPKLPDGSAVPLFADFLSLIAGRVPVIVEIKGYGDPRETAEATLRALRAYRGPYCIESFAPQAVGYFKRHAPEIIRGQLAGGNPASIRTKGFWHYFSHKHLLYNAIGRPHFIAYDVNHAASPSLLLDKRLFGAFLVAWTVRSQQTLDSARKRYDTWIFELFTPADKRRETTP